MKRILIVMAIGLLFVCVLWKYSSNGEEGTTLGGNATNNSSYVVKTAAYWTSPVMAKTDAIRLARHDIVIVDLENMFNNYSSLEELKRTNPKLKLLAYSNPMEIWLTKYGNRSWQNRVIDEIVFNRPDWLLKTITSDSTSRRENYATFWNGMTVLNMSSACPRIKGDTYQEWMAKKISTEILSDSIWDGYFQDNGTGNISWLYPSENEKIDINGNQKPDKNERIDKKWHKGMKRYLTKISSSRYKKKSSLSFLYGIKSERTATESIIVITNKGSLDFASQVNGKFFEKFPNDYLGDKKANGWFQCMNNASKLGPMTIFQADRSNIDFVLASSLLLDNVYVAISQDDAGIFPELEVDLGLPTGKMFTRDSISFFREYEKGIVIVHPIEKIGEIRKKIKI